MVNVSEILRSTRKNRINLTIVSTGLPTRWDRSYLNRNEVIVAKAMELVVKSLRRQLRWVPPRLSSSPATGGRCGLGDYARRPICAGYLSGCKPCTHSRPWYSANARYPSASCAPRKSCVHAPTVSADRPAPRTAAPFSLPKQPCHIHQTSTYK